MKPSLNFSVLGQFTIFYQCIFTKILNLIIYKYRWLIKAYAKAQGSQWLSDYRLTNCSQLNRTK